jgi:hypothetical protein
LLPVFAGVEGGERIFMLASVVVLLSVVVHGGGTAFFLRASARKDRETSGPPASAPAEIPGEMLVPRSRAASGGQPVEDRITLDELRALEEKGEPVIILDARAPRNYDGDPLIARGALRLRPDDPVRDAREMRLSKHATLVIYCA